MNPTLRLKRLAALPRRLKYRRQIERFNQRQPELGRLIEQVREKRITFLSPQNLVDLADAVLDAEVRHLPGAILEAGTALGGSAIVLARAKATERPMWVFDAFGMIPPPSDKDGADIHARYDEIVSGKSAGIGDDLYYGYHDDLLTEVSNSFREFGADPAATNVTMVKGYYEDTMRVNFPVALAHLDCDWYESLMVCLREIEPHLVVGGRFVIDDYYNWSGCTRAVDEFFADRPGYQWVHKSRLHLIKRSAGVPGR